MQVVQFDKQTTYFDKDVTAIIKGIALVMMFTHHFFTFPTWWLDGIKYPFWENVAKYFCAPLRLCVPIFYFLSGYFYFHNKNKSYQYSFRKITDILIKYWIVFFIFAIIAVITVHYIYTPISFIQEMFALYMPTMPFCWYVSFYCLFMLLLPLFAKLPSQNVHFDFFTSIVLFPVITDVIDCIVKKYIGNDIIIELTSNLFFWFPMVLLGYIFAKYKLFDRMEYNTSKIIHSKKATIILQIIGALCAPMGRYVLPYFSFNVVAVPIIHKSINFSVSMDVVYTPIFIFYVVNLCRNIKLTYTKLILKQIGKHSLLMWFVSCIFFNNSKTVFQHILYWPRNSCLVLIWGLLICYIVSAILNLGLNIILRQKNKIFFRQA